MAIKSMICGISGTGKSRSLKEFATENIPVAVVNPVNKPLPFRHNFEMLNGETDSNKIIEFMINTTILRPIITTSSRQRTNFRTM